VLLPFHETWPFGQALDEHVRRFGEMLPILADHGLSLGLEYVSPLSRRAPYAHHFVHDLKGTLQLMEAVDANNLGLLLDSLHWHCAGETKYQLMQLQPEQVVLVHINDALDRPLEEQVVGERTLPATTGVIHITAFMDALRHIGYDGPVTCEPMSNAIEALKSNNEDENTSAVTRAMDKVMPQ
jgi:sugar phosphate isomerase/epimerase